MASQRQMQKHSNVFTCRRLIILILVILIVVFAITGILTQGAWAYTVSISLTAFGTAIALFSYWSSSSALATSRKNYVQSTSKSTSRSNPSRKVPQGIPYVRFEGINVNLGVSEQAGALIVYVPRNLRSWTLHLVTGPIETPSKLYSTNVLEYTVNGRLVDALIFPRLEPDNYTLFRAYENPTTLHYLGREFRSIDENQQEAQYDYVRQVTVLPGRVSYIDVRLSYS